MIQYANKPLILMLLIKNKLYLLIACFMFIFQGGIYLFQLADWYFSFFALLFGALFECISICWVYGKPLYYYREFFVHFTSTLTFNCLIGMPSAFVINMYVQYNRELYNWWLSFWILFLKYLWLKMYCSTCKGKIIKSIIQIQKVED
jgi:hypothetical protein